jgi:hypothetical protein
MVLGVRPVIVGLNSGGVLVLSTVLESKIVGLGEVLQQNPLEMNVPLPIKEIALEYLTEVEVIVYTPSGARAGNIAPAVPETSFP